MKDIHKDKIKSHQIIGSLIGSYSVSSIVGVMLAFFIFSADSFAQDSDIDYDDVYGSKKKPYSFV